MAGKDKDFEREFSEYLDKILAGEEIKPGDEINEDMRAAIEFSRDMRAQRSEPSDAFREELKRKLLHRLVEEEIRATQKEKRGWFSNTLLWRSLATVAVAVALAAIGFFIYMQGFPGSQEEPLPTVQPTATQPSPTTTPTMTTQPTSTQPMPTAMPTAEPTTQPTATSMPVPTYTIPVIRIEAPTIEPTITIPEITVPDVVIPSITVPSMTVPDITVTEPAPQPKLYAIAVMLADWPYVPGQQVEIEFAFANTSASVLQLEPFPPEITIRSIANNNTVRTLFIDSETALLDPGETINFTFLWDQLDDNDEQVPPGMYRIILGDIFVDGQQYKLELESGSVITIHSPDE